MLASGEPDAVWMPDRETWVMRRRLARRGQLVWARSRAKNQIHAVLMRCLVGRVPFSDLFGVEGRRWLAELELPGVDILELREERRAVLRENPPNLIWEPVRGALAQDLADQRFVDGADAVLCSDLAKAIIDCVRPLQRRG